MKSLRWVVFALPLVAMLTLPAVRATAQPLPIENHYFVYHAAPPIFLPKVVGLSDQFGNFSVTDLYLDRFANPAEKRLPDGTTYPMIDPLAHQTWWRINVPQPSRTVIGIDQFGTHSWVLGDAVYLLLPAFKNVAAGVPPVRNHYVCYAGQAGSTPLPVVLIDQFGQFQVQVMQPKLFCNPAEKRADGLIYPIVDPIAHLACYDVLNPTPFAHAIVAIDQFGQWQLDVFQADCLCVPSLKEHVLKTDTSTWGRIKAMYH